MFSLAVVFHYDANSTAISVNIIKENIITAIKRTLTAIQLHIHSMWNYNKYMLHPVKLITDFNKYVELEQID